MIGKSTEQNVVRSYRLYSILLFFVFGTIIALLTTVVYSYLDLFHQKEQLESNTILVVIGMVLLISLPVALLISKLPTILQRNIARQNKKLREYVAVIDENIITSESDTDGTIVDVSTAFAKTSGYSKTELVGNTFAMLRHEEFDQNVYEQLWEDLREEKTCEGEIQQKAKDGQGYWTKLTVTPNRDESDRVVSYTAIHQDITDRKRLEKLSITDELTGLYNRRNFNTILEQELNRAHRNRRLLSFGMMEVDHFEQYNDHYGHQKGEAVLRTIGRVLKEKLSRASDYSFRLDGEKFGLIFNDLQEEEGRAFAERIRQTIHSFGIEHKYSGVADEITVSIGVLTVIPAPGVTVDDIYKAADEALSMARQKGRNRVYTMMLGE